MIMTVRTPNVCNWLMSAAESARGGSLSAMIPASFTAPDGPMATASTRKPLASSWSTILVASGDACERVITAEKAPFTARTVAPLESTAVASDILVAESKGTNFSNLGRFAAGVLAEAARMATSTESCPTMQTGESGDSQNVCFIKPVERMDGRHLQLILGQRAGLIHAQDLNAGRFVHGGETRGKNANFRQRPGANGRG